MDFDGIVLAGGDARRLGGRDKAALVIGGVRLLDRAVAALAEAKHVIVVGPHRRSPAGLEWTLESPSGTGPVAALAAGLERTDARTVAVLAVDLPFANRAVVSRLVSSIGSHDGAALVDPSGTLQPLAAAYRPDALRRAVARLRSVEHASMNSLIAGLSLVRVRETMAWRDCDTWDDVVAARRALGGEDVLEAWIAELSPALGVDERLDADALLDASRVVAHKVERRAAPVTTYLMGLAVAQGRPLDDVTRQVIALARVWEPPPAGP